MTDKNHQKNSQVLSSLKAPWDRNDNIIWLASTLRLCRNIEKFKFPQKLDVERKKQVLSLITQTFLTTTELTTPIILPSEEITAAQKEFLIEHFLISEGFQEADQGTAFGIDATGEFISLFNINAHVQLQITDCSGDLEKSWNRLAHIEKTMQKNFKFAFSTKFGFLTSDPMHCGTGLIVSAFLHVPALIHTNGLFDCLEREKGEGIISSGLQGNPDEFIGDILMIHNRYTLGVNEETILSSLRNAVLHTVIAEKAARSQIKSQNNKTIKDLIAKAIGLLKFSYQLEVLEALNAISMVKLGIELGWVKGMEVREVNSLFFNCRRIHLSYSLGETTPAEDIAIKRAEYLRKVSEPLAAEFL